MKLASPSFEHSRIIPDKFTCDGPNTSPELVFSVVPAEAKSLVLIMDDPDIPDFVTKKMGVTVWDHWVVFNIPPGTKIIKEGTEPPGTHGKGTGGNLKYNGPCPPDKEHRYFFKLYALDTTLNLPEGSTKVQVEQAMEGHIITKAELMGRYTKVVNR